MARGSWGKGFCMSSLPWSVFQLETEKKSKKCKAGCTQSFDVVVEIWARWQRSTGSGVFYSNSEGGKKGGYPEMSETWAELEVQWSRSSREGVRGHSIRRKSQSRGAEQSLLNQEATLCGYLWSASAGVAWGECPSLGKAHYEGPCAPKRSLIYLFFLVWQFVYVFIRLFIFIAV